jgi:hypothetical protein
MMKNTMKNSLAAFVVGFVFSMGLGISGMTQPQKVVGFLDLFGQWDPSLIFCHDRCHPGTFCDLSIDS